MMRFCLQIVLLSAIPITGCATATNPPKPIMIKVVDEDGGPVEGARVRYVFYGVTSDKTVIVGAKTDGKGLAEETGPSYFGAKVQITKEGYYKSTIDRVREDRNAPKWSREVVLREIKNPIPMYAKKVGSYIPAKNTTIGYDFTAGDWVSPHGDGTVSHMYFMYSGSVEDYFNYVGELKVSFRNEGDGLMEVVDPYRDISRLKLPHQAPPNGYQAGKRWELKSSGQDSSNKIDAYERSLSYYLRINTTIGEDEDVASANYGKIYGDIRFHLVPEVEAKGRGPGYVSFTYYYNPSPNDRNVEMDPERNLLDSEVERVDWEVKDP